MAELTLQARAPFAGLKASSSGNGVTVSPRDGLGLATVMVRKGRMDAFRQRVREVYGIDLQVGARRNVAGAVAFIGTGPTTWLAISDVGGNAFAASLKHALGELASIADQSDGYAVLRLSGPHGRDALAKGFAIDLHDKTFGNGDVAATIVSHIGVTIWRLDDAADGSPTFEIAVFRSLAGSFWHWLSDSAAEFGMVDA